MAARNAIGRLGASGILLLAWGLLSGAPADPPGDGGTLDLVTLSVENMDVKEVLAMLSDSRELNIICEAGVEGRVSIELHAVPFQEALRAAVAMAGFEVIRRGNIYFVRQPGEESPVEMVMHETRTFQLDYAQPDEITPVVGELLSPAGRIMSYGPLRAVVVNDRSAILDRVAVVLQQIDQPPRQVMIEAQIMEARLSSDLRYGIDWTLFFSSGDGDGTLTVEGFASPAVAGAEGFFVTWGEGDFTTALQCLEGVDELTTLAAPRVLAVDGKEAQIMIGGQLGFSVVTTVDNTVIQSVEFLDTGTKLVITPTIAGDGMVMMTIHPELSDGVISEGLPSKTTTEVTSDVLVADGQTLFIGGLIRDRDELVRRGIPVLMNLPLVGPLFGRTTHAVQKSELIVLITPHVVQPGEAVPYEGAGLLTPGR